MGSFTPFQREPWFQARHPLLALPVSTKFFSTMHCLLTLSILDLFDFISHCIRLPRFFLPSLALHPVSSCDLARSRFLTFFCWTDNLRSRKSLWSHGFIQTHARRTPPPLRNLDLSLDTDLDRHRLLLLTVGQQLVTLVPPLFLPRDLLGGPCCGGGCSARLVWNLPKMANAIYFMWKGEKGFITSRHCYWTFKHHLDVKVMKWSVYTFSSTVKCYDISSFSVLHNKIHAPLSVTGLQISHS